MMQKPRDSENIQPPAAPAGGAEVIRAMQLVSEDYYADAVFEAADFFGQTARHLIFERVSFQRVTAHGTVWESVRLTDAAFLGCDLSNAQWEKATIWRASITSSRLTGFRLVEGELEDVLFRECNAPMLQLFGSTLRAVRFEECKLREADLREADLRGVVFDNCDLATADFRGAKLAGADLRGSIIDGIQVGAPDLRGARVDLAQAAYLASLESVLGLEVG
jgi:uncharacterized protein YjbI with pentapeptide repeats